MEDGNAGCGSVTTSQETANAPTHSPPAPQKLERAGGLFQELLGQHPIHT